MVTSGDRKTNSFGKLVRQKVGLFSSWFSLRALEKALKGPSCWTASTMSRSIHQSKRILRPSSREALSSQRRRAHQRAIIRSRSEPFTRQRRSSIALARIWHSKIRRRSPQTTCCTTCERSCRKCRRPPRNVKPTPLRERHRSRRACNSRSSLCSWSFRLSAGLFASVHVRGLSVHLPDVDFLTG